MKRPDVPHYTSPNSSLECIDVIRAALGDGPFVDYCRGQTLKYVWRMHTKGDPRGDLLKALAYAGFALDALRGDN